MYRFLFFDETFKIFFLESEIDSETESSSSNISSSSSSESECVKKIVKPQIVQRKRNLFEMKKELNYYLKSKHPQKYLKRFSLRNLITLRQVVKSVRDLKSIKSKKGTLNPSKKLLNVFKDNQQNVEALLKSNLKLNKQTLVSSFSKINPKALKKILTSHYKVRQMYKKS